MRIEVGYGLEGRLTDARSRQILDDIVRPHFRAGNFGAGIEAGVDAIAAVIEGAPLPAPRRDPARQIGSIVGILLFSLMFLVVIGTFSVVALLTPGSAGWFLYLFLTPFYAIFPSIVLPPYGGVIAAGSWLALFPIVRSLLHSPGGKKFRERHGWVITPDGAGGRWSSGGVGRRLRRRRRLLGGRRILGRRRRLQQLVGLPTKTRRGAGPRPPADPSALASPLARGAFPGRPARSPAQGSHDVRIPSPDCPATASSSAVACPPWMSPLTGLH